MDITQVTQQRLSGVIADFRICPRCGTVDGHPGRVQAGHRCHSCGQPVESPCPLYFPQTTLSLIDLMQEFYHLKPSTILHFQETPAEERNGHQLILVILFCTLVEVLFQKFLEECLEAEGVQARIRARLLKDNLYMHQRVKRLFPTLTDSTWPQAVGRLGKRHKQNYSRTAQFYEETSEARNEFLHRGGDWAIPKEMPEQCIRHLRPLVLLFVDLHNEYARRPLDPTGARRKK